MNNAFDLTVKEAQHFFFNDLRLIPCKLLHGIAYKNGEYASVIQVYFCRFPIVVDNNSVYAKDDERIVVTESAKNGFRVFFKENDNDK